MLGLVFCIEVGYIEEQLYWVNKAEQRMELEAVIFGGWAFVRWLVSRFVKAMERLSWVL